MPNARALFSSLVTSAMYARAVVMFPPDNPSTILATNSIVRLRATASMAKLTTVPSRLKIRIGRRPHRSDISPRTGEATSWLRENDANSSPITIGEAPNVWA